jgi:hypothetical protein
MMCCLIRAVYEYGTIDWCYAGESRKTRNYTCCSATFSQQISCEVTRHCFRSFAVNPQRVITQVTAQPKVYTSAKFWNYSRFNYLKFDDV